MKILVTGAAGFIGFHLCKRLIKESYTVIGIDSLNDYYDPKLKEARLKELGIEDILQQKSTDSPHFEFFKLDLNEKERLMDLFAREEFDIVINLAAQAGVRNSITHPEAYIENNINGFFNLLECCRKHKPQHLIFASSSSVYGLNKKTPFSTTDHTDHPVSLYAATKKSNEMMAHTYSHLFDIPTTGLRFFTVYGAWGRPDMAYFSFTQKILRGETIKVFNQGNLMRDFTYIDDVIEGIFALLLKIPQKDKNSQDYENDPSQSTAAYRLFNIGNNTPVRLLDFIRIIEKELKTEAKLELVPMQAGDVFTTYADIDPLHALTEFKPKTPLQEGFHEFYKWYQSFYS